MIRSIRIAIATVAILNFVGPHFVRGDEPAGASTSVAAPVERYFVIVFGYQDGIARPRNTHSFATFVKLTGDNSAGQPPAIESHTISWLPARFGQNHRLTWLARPGHNYTLGQTLAFAGQLGLAVRYWGPYEIDESLYRRALGQIAYLNSGAVAYKLLEPVRHRWAFRHEPGAAVDCIYAVSDVNGFVRTGFLRGYNASAFIASHFSNHYLSWQTYPWVYDAVMATGNAGASPGRPSLPPAIAPPALPLITQRPRHP